MLEVIGVRHWSPACARLVRARIQALQPRWVLIEGPSDFNPRLAELALPHTLPIALYSYYGNDAHTSSCHAPFAEFAPEWVALKTAFAAGIGVRFIDLPYWHPGARELPQRYTLRTLPGRERYSKYARALLRNGAKSTPFFQQPSGLIIEIIPTADPYSLKPGDQLPVQVLFRSKPAANLHMEASWAHGSETKSVSAGRTDANGRLTVTLPEAGLWRLHTIKMERCADPAAADWESFWSSLTFELENAK